MTASMSKRQCLLRITTEADARLDELAAVAGDRGRAVDALLRALPVEELAELIRERMARDELAESAWSRSR